MARDLERDEAGEGTAKSDMCGPAGLRTGTADQEFQEPGGNRRSEDDPQNDDECLGPSGPAQHEDLDVVLKERQRRLGDGEACDSEEFS